MDPALGAPADSGGTSDPGWTSRSAPIATSAPQSEAQHPLKRTNYFLLLVDLIRHILLAILGGMTATLQRWQDLQITMGLFSRIAMPLALNVIVWNAFFKLTNGPLLALWPNRFIVELLIPLGVKLKTSNEPSACYGHIAGWAMIAITLTLIRITWVALRWLGVPALGEAWVALRNWGWHRSMRLILTGFAGWRMYNYYLHYSELASNARWSYTQYLLNFLQPPALRYFQRQYCPRVEFFINHKLNFPLCATKTLDSYTWNSQLILLPWTQHSLTDGYLSMTGQTPEQWDDSNPLEAVLLWITFGSLYFYFFDIFPYSYTVLPQQFLKAAAVRKPIILAFISFQVLRFIFNILPRFILGFPSLILRPIQYPFRYLLRNTRVSTRFVVGVVVYLCFINWWELWIFLYFFPPQDEWELQTELIVVKTFVYICGVVFYSAYWLIWYKEWSRNVMWPEQRAAVELLQMVQGPRIEGARRALRYWDGFWRYDEKNRTRSSLEYVSGFNVSEDFCRFILRPLAAIAVLGWYLYCTIIILRFLAQVVFSQPVTFALTWEWIFWWLVAPPIFCWVADETLFGEEDVVWFTERGDLNMLV
ncbi:hypothetical protein EV426DRAFT_574653 [Tirmania nivea]|nr:hypothetical protein EV426DRAFT_574653 [Tirmania nivea]